MESLERKFRVAAILCGIVVIPVIVFMVIRVQRSISERRHTAEKRPVISNSNAPVLLQPFTCNLKTGTNFGDIQTFFRNVGNGDALAVTPTFVLRLVPDRKAGMPEFDEIPSGGCRAKTKRADASRVAAGQSRQVKWPRPAVALPPLLNGETTQLFGMSCIYYADAAGADHSACDTYMFRLDTGLTVFACDDLPKNGKFDPDPVVRCAN